MVIAVKSDFLDLHLLAPVYRKVHPDSALYHRIFLCLDIDFCQKETLFLKIPYDYIGGRLGHVIGKFPSPLQVQALHQFFLLSRLHSGKGPAGNPWTFHYGNLEESGIGGRDYGIDYHSDILEVALHPKPVHYRRHIIARNSDLHSLLEACQLDYLSVTEIVVSFDSNASDFIFLRIVIIYHNTVFSVLGRQGDRNCGQKKEKDYPTSSHRQL